jgi:multiple sugar transport system substrate-binding protein
MKKILCLLLAFTFCISAAACGAPSRDAPVQSSGTGEHEQTGLPDGEIGGEITISCYDTMTYKSFLEDAAKLFEEKYPGTEVNVETFSAMPEISTSEQDGGTMTAVQIEDDPQGRADYINKVNTSLMSGEGADIYAMDVLPIHKYAESGQLENLDTYMDSDPDFNREDYRENLLEAIRYKGGTWFLPMDYTFDYYAYDSTLISEEQAEAFGTGSAFSAQQLIELAGPLYDGEAKLFNSPDYVKGIEAGMFGQLLKEAYSSFVDLENKTANFNDGAFAELLSAVKEYGELGYIPQGVTGQENVGMFMQGKPQEQTERFFFKPKNNFTLSQQVSKALGLNMMMAIAGAGGGIEDDDKVAGIQADNNGNVPFDFQQAYGINADSDNKATAWAFLKFLLSEEMQLSTQLLPLSLPLNNAAREKKAELVVSGAFMGLGKELDEDQKEMLSQYTEAVEQLSDQINSYRIEDIIVNDMIAAEVSYFFDGTKTAEEVADVLQNKVDLYLNE